MKFISSALAQLSIGISFIPLTLGAIDYCMDSPTKIVYGDQNISCDDIAEDTSRCDIEGVSSHCPKTCNMCIQYGCEDSTMTVTANGQTGTCAMVASNLEYCENDLVKNTCKATCKACFDNSAFTIRLLNMGTNTDFDQAFINAQERWQGIIRNDLPDIEAGTYTDLFGDVGDFNNPIPFNGAVDDVVIAYSIEYLDGFGEGTILGYANTVKTRSGRGGPISGIMKFDEDDFNGPKGDDAEIIILHEMGHILGAVNVNNNCNFLCIFNVNYGCNKAKEMYAEIYPDTKLKLEDGYNSDGAQRCYHWEEDMFPLRLTVASELMTGKFEQGISQPITKVTLGGLEDTYKGYEVDYTAADPYPADEGSRTDYTPVNVPVHTFDIGDGSILPGPNRRVLRA